MKTTPDIADAAAAFIRIGSLELRQKAQSYRDIEELDAAQRCLLLAHASDEAASLLREQYAPRPVHWWILEGGFFAKGGTKYSGPYLVEIDAITARAALERALGHNSLFVDSEPSNSQEDTNGWHAHGLVGSV